MSFHQSKDPDASLDYQFDWGAYLGDDTISLVTWVVPAGIVEERTQSDDTTATIWLSGGNSGNDYAVVCRITTTAGRIDDRTLVLTVREK